MSRFYYLGSPVPLPCGERGLAFTMKPYREVVASPEHQLKQEESGRIPIGDIVDLSHFNDKLVMAFETEEDAAGIVLQELGAYREAVRHHFKQPYVYQISAEGGGFEIPNPIPAEVAENFLPVRKCCRLLGELLREFAVPGEYFEFYTCWAGEERWPRNHQLDRAVELASYIWEEGLQPQEKQYMRLF